MEPTQKYQIDIVEDDKVMAELLRYKIEREGQYTVRWFSTPQKWFKSDPNNTSMVILDYHFFPEEENLTGLETIRQMKLMNEKMPIVILSGQEEVEVGIELVNAGACDYIHKTEPSMDEKLLETLKSVFVYQQNTILENEIKLQRNRKLLRLAAVLGGIIAALALAIVLAA